MTSKTNTVTVTAREERAVRAAIRQNGGFILRSSIVGAVIREEGGVWVNKGNGFKITYTVYR